LSARRTQADLGRNPLRPAEPGTGGACPACTVRAEE